MRFRKGDKVEVISKKEGSLSWRLAEVLSCNDRSLCLLYNPFPGGEKELMVETVSREFVRPDPPPVQGLENCISGDIVEVFHQFSWNIAAIVKIMGSKRENMSNKIYGAAATFQNKYLVRIIGSSKELIIDQSNLRLRQTWHHDKWILMGKIAQSCEDTRASKPSTSNCYQKNFQISTTQKDFICNDVGFRKSPTISAKSLKRISPNGDRMAEAHNGPVCKFRAVEKDGRRQRTITAPVLEKGINFCLRMYLINLQSPAFSRASVGGVIMYFKRFKDDTWICQRSLGIYYWMIRHLLPNRCINLWLLPGIKRWNPYNYFSKSDEQKKRMVCTSSEKGICSLSATSEWALNHIGLSCMSNL
ncbi:uncharacterized protein [Primulina huaijiensis]|uniref:uncharacterized protein isoform X4 n=1 Tax=Primulina huaijiensis TaxID=1492673 RepID=UPI003CC72697